MSGSRQTYADRLNYLANTLGEGIISESDIKGLSSRKGLIDDRTQQGILRDYVNSQNIPVINPQPANIPQSTMRVPLGMEFDPRFADLTANTGAGAVPSALNYGQAATTAPYPYLNTGAVQQTALPAMQPSALPQQASQGFWDRFKAGIAKNAAQPKDFPVSDRR